MYGMLSRLQIAPDLDAPPEALCPSPRHGDLGRYTYRLPGDPDGLYLMRLFTSRAAYLAEALST